MALKFNRQEYYDNNQQTNKVKGYNQPADSQDGFDSVFPPEAQSLGS